MSRYSYPIFVIFLFLAIAPVVALGRSGIHEAIKNNDLTKVQFILRSRPNSINEPGYNRMGFSPLYHAVLQKNEEIVKLLIDSGSDINRVEKNDYTALHCASELGLPRIVKILVKAGAYVVPRIPGEISPLQRALWTNHGVQTVEVVLFLVQNGADTKEKNSDGKTLLHGAAYGGNPAIIQFLLSKGLDPNSIDDEGDAPMTLIFHDNLKKIEWNHIKCVKAFLKGGANINYRKNRNVLYYGVSLGSKELVGYLLENGADPNLEGFGGRPVELAERKGFSEIFNGFE